MHKYQILASAILSLSSHLISSFSSVLTPPPLPSPCYLSTRPWHLSLRSVALSVALGWWMGWWTLGCHGNLMDGLATDTSAERAHQQTHTATQSPSQRMWVLDFEISRPQTVTTPFITNTADPWLQRRTSVQSYHHFCWRHRGDEVRQLESRSEDNSLSVNVNKTKEMIVDFRRTGAWAESQQRQRGASGESTTPPL